MRPRISIIVPVYNEEPVITETYARLKKVMDSLGGSYELIFINDGSRDKSAHIIYDLHQKDPVVKLLNFSRNFGHQSAITAGMDYAEGDAVVIIDADLQDPPEVIPKMVELWESGFEVVYGKRINREGETWFKRTTSKIYYRLLKKLTSVDIPVDTGDFRLIDRKVCLAMRSLNEKNRYVRGLISWVGFKQTACEYERLERFAGKTKYPLAKMVKLAMDGITSFSYIPLKLATSIGFALSVLSFIYLVFVFIQRIFTDTTVTGWASTLAVILLSQGIILMMLGLMGEYIGRIFDEIKNRPTYIVRERIGFTTGSDTFDRTGGDAVQHAITSTGSNKPEKNGGDGDD